MNITEYKLNELAKNELRDHALYTVSARAIPSMIDGLKPVQRFYLYSSLINTPKDYKKVSAVAGVVSDYGYNHAETSASAAGQLMAATWSNNVCLIEGRGNLGTRQVQAAAAPRYVYSRIHENFRKYIKDLELSPEHEDPEHQPPKYYIPAIPLVLVNGVVGIATGFATNILPRDSSSIISAIKEYLTTADIKAEIPVKFPDFRGTVKYEDGRYICYGDFTRRSMTVIDITEIPYSFDRESYVTILNKLEDDGLISSYEDLCDSTGFNFSIKLNKESKNWDDDEVVKRLKLSKPYSENITVLNEDGKLVIYEDCRELIKDFVAFRIGVLSDRIKLRINEFEESMRFATVKMQFITAVLDGDIIFKNKKTTDVHEMILKFTDANAEDLSRLLAMNIMSLTKEHVEKLAGEISNIKKEIVYWNSTSEIDQYFGDLDSL